MSRRLARRLYSDLHRRRYGYVKLTVEAYIYLLKAYRPEKSSLFANELVVRSVVGLRCMGSWCCCFCCCMRGCKLAR